MPPIQQILLYAIRKSKSDLQFRIYEVLIYKKKIKEEILLLPALKIVGSSVFEQNFNSIRSSMLREAHI